VSPVSGRIAGRTSCCILLWAAWCAPGAWAQQSVPPAATPGGVQPRSAQEFPDASQLTPFSVPRVPERPLGLDEGPRVRVARFDLMGAATQPGVPKAAVDEVLASAIANQPAEGFTVNELQQVADRVAEEYRSRGLLLTQAIVPAQEVHRGVVNILVLDGALSELRFEGQQMYSTRTLSRPFKHLLSRPVRRDEIESALLHLTDYPGLSAFAMFQAGDRVGTTDLLIRTQREDRFVLDTSLDNQGSQYSGEYRGTLGLTLNNPFGQADRLNVYGLYAFDPDDSDSKGAYGGMSYRVPLMGPTNQLQVEYSHNLFEVGQILRQLGIKGTTDIAKATYTRSLVKTRLTNASAQLAFAHKDAEFEQQGAIAANDVLSIASVGLNWSNIGLRTRGITQLSLTYSHGFADLFGSLDDYDRQSGIKASRLDASGAFDKLSLQVQRYQRISQNNAVLLRASGQYSDDILVSLEQFSIGGPDTVRAYPSAEFLADTAGFASIELIMNAPGFASRPAFGGRTWGQLLQFSLFADYATGKLNLVLPGEKEEIDLYGWGAAVQFNLARRYFARVDVATPLSDEEPSNRRDPQYFFRFGFTL
jgi:hemolysin activation/secretion protein